MKWKRIFSKEPHNNADSVVKQLPIVTIWNKSEQVMSQWQDSWNVTTVEKIGEIDTNIYLYKIHSYSIHLFLNHLFLVLKSGKT